MAAWWKLFMFAVITLLPCMRDDYDAIVIAKNSLRIDQYSIPVVQVTYVPKVCRVPTLEIWLL